MRSARTIAIVRPSSVGMDAMISQSSTPDVCVIRKRAHIRAQKVNQVTRKRAMTIAGLVQSRVSGSVRFAVGEA